MNRLFAPPFPDRSCSRERQVALMLDTSSEYGRGIMKGIQTYMSKERSWSVYLLEQSQLADFTWLHEWDGDGLLTMMDPASMVEYVRQSGIPAVQLTASDLIPELPAVAADNRMIGHWAANHFMQSGFSSFAYCGDNRLHDSIARQIHYTELLEQSGFSCVCFQASGEVSFLEERHQLAAWVRRLPKPVGILACHDRLGQSLLEACHLAQMQVPDEVAVMGVNNDIWVCEMSRPPLSSIKLDAVQMGYQAASMLEDMMAGVYVEAKLYEIKPIDLVVRSSTRKQVVKDAYVSEAICYIDRHIYEELRVEHVLNHLLISRRSLDHRFLKEIGQTAHEYMMETKVKQVMKLLEESELTLQAIADRLGFKHPEYLSVVFKRMTGWTPSAYRDMYKGKKN